MVMTENAERKPGFIVKALDPSGNFTTYFRQEVEINETLQKVFRVKNNVRPYPWKTDNGLPPPDKPPCGFFMEYCQIDYTSKFTPFFSYFCLLSFFLLYEILT